MKRLPPRVALAALTVATGIVVAGPAASSDATNGPVASENPRPAVAVVGPAVDCRLRALESVKIRKTRSIHATALGLFPKGKTTPCLGLTYDGGSYSLCGRKNWPTWREVNYRNIRGWVPYACVEPY
ncbi:hypothetical protein NE236_05740 [Actinoallomurus purpureus]|uniref:hypothetical protein n=1 Tax=Actinoallomurus purpureus TaxID=478114 RepID=UPI0020937011|nr:hypothetical protein [Actinoallomurus purpureus]MCO6004479.1 hypothetical protein [Actinoallomurus purpureus]